MYLLIDSGNTQVKYMLSSHGEMQTIQRCQNQQFLKVLESLEGIEKVLLASVASETFVGEVERWAATHNISCQRLVTESQSFSIKNSYRQYQTMGVDRWLAVIGAQALYPQRNLIIVDSGTATTIDILAANKQHMGGWIVPGIELLAQSLFANTDKVFGEVSEVSQLEFGKSTSDNVNFGAWAMSIAVIEQARLLCQQQQLDNSLVLFTGGYGATLNKVGGFQGIDIADLVFHGIARFI